MEICDIQKKKVGISNKIEITFCSSETADDVLTIIINENDMSQLHDFWQRNLDYTK